MSVIPSVVQTKDWGRIYEIDISGLTVPPLPCGSPGWVCYAPAGLPVSRGVRA